jgi:hypothetical protein
MTNDAKEFFGEMAEDELVFEEDHISQLALWTWERTHQGQELDAVTAHRMPETLRKAPLSTFPNTETEPEPKPAVKPQFNR